jgi:tRNA threonylcarbamoyladenosine biosynthesis protein TsaE
MIIKSDSAAKTQEIAAQLANKYLHSGVIIALSGDLGAGKTTFTQGFAKALGIKEKIPSPTFVITRQYPIPNTDKYFYHLDLYRLETGFDTMNIGIGEILSNQKNLVLVEWSEKLGNSLPKTAIKISFKYLSENEREIEIND